MEKIREYSEKKVLKFIDDDKIDELKEMIDYIYNDIKQDYELIDRLCENVYNEMMREVKIAVSHCDSVGNLENRFDLQAYIIM